MRVETVGTGGQGGGTTSGKRRCRHPLGPAWLRIAFWSHDGEALGSAYVPGDGVEHSRDVFLFPVQSSIGEGPGEPSL